MSTTVKPVFWKGSEDLKTRITEYLDIDHATEMWHCNRCGEVLTSAHNNYKEGCLVYERDPREIHNPIVEGYEFSFAPDPNWCRIVEFYCPHCGTMVEVEYLPPGHPVTHDIEPDLVSLKQNAELQRGKAK